MKSVKPEIINEMKLKIPSLSVNESTARTMIAAFSAQADPTTTELADIKCAVSEAVTNCIVHAYPNKIGEIYISVQIFAQRQIKITIRDRGCGIENVKKAREPLFTTSPESERSGMGFTVMESFTDKLTVRSKKDKGTVVSFVKQLSERKRAE